MCGFDSRLQEVEELGSSGFEMLHININLVRGGVDERCTCFVCVKERQESLELLARPRIVGRSAIQKVPYGSFTNQNRRLRTSYL